MPDDVAHLLVTALIVCVCILLACGIVFGAVVTMLVAA